MGRAKIILCFDHCKNERSSAHRLLFHVFPSDKRGRHNRIIKVIKLIIIKVYLMRLEFENNLHNTMLNTFYVPLVKLIV